MRDKSHKIYLNRCRKSIDKLNTHFWCLKNNLSKQDIENFNLIKKPPVGLYSLTWWNTEHFPHNQKQGKNKRVGLPEVNR